MLLEEIKKITLFDKIYENGRMFPICTIFAIYLENLRDMIYKSSKYNKNLFSNVCKIYLRKIIFNFFIGKEISIVHQILI